MITFGGGFITSSPSGIIDDSGNDIGASLKALMDQGSEICVYGCNTARVDENLARDLNQMIPQSSVTGYRFYAVGGTNFGVHSTAGFEKTYSAEQENPYPDEFNPNRSPIFLSNYLNQYGFKKQN